MKYFFSGSLFILLITALSSFECSKKSATPVPGDIQAVSTTASIPVLKGLANNPIVRVSISIPEGHTEQQYRKINCTLNQAALSEIQKIDIFYTGAEPFSSNTLVATVPPSGTTLSIPVDLKLKPGMHFIWFSVVLKDDAGLNHPIELHAVNLTENSGRQVRISETSAGYIKKTGTAVRKAGDDGVNTYRIPGIITTDKGTLISVYDIRYFNSKDLPGNIDVGMSRSTDGGNSWEPMKVIMDMGAPHENNGIGDPAILIDPVTKKIYVAALWSKGNRSIAGSMPGLSPDTTGQFVLVSSSDDGLTWTAPVSITPHVKNPIWHLFFNGPGSGIAMQDGRLVFAAQYWDEKKVPHSTIIYSNDHGASWKGNIAGPKSNTTESQVVETQPGTLMLNMRDNRGGFRSVATTNNMGTTWTEHSSSYNTLPDPVCMGSLIKARVKINGVIKEILFFSNPNTVSGRYNMTIKASLDFGQTWLAANQLLIDERNCYGYSSLTQIDENTIGILYEGTKDLYFLKVPVSEIVK